jgi:hypothetical protein
VSRYTVEYERFAKKLEWVRRTVPASDIESAVFIYARESVCYDVRNAVIRDNETGKTFIPHG